MGGDRIMKRTEVQYGGLKRWCGGEGSTLFFTLQYRRDVQEEACCSPNGCPDKLTAKLVGGNDP